jgi:hypothetical protein
MNEEASGSAFNPRLILWLVGAAILSFVGFLFLSSYAPEMRSGRDGRGHALSVSAIGYKALVDLQEDLGRSPDLIRDDEGRQGSRLLVVTPEFDHADSLAALIAKRSDIGPTLIILPKRAVTANPKKPGWVIGRDVLSQAAVEELIQQVAPVKVGQNKARQTTVFTSDFLPPARFPEGTIVQTISGADLDPLLSDAQGHILLAATSEESGVYIAADPDLFNNLGMRDPGLAYAATQILDELSTDKTKQVNFDILLNGFTRGRGLLRLAFEPPFLALTTALMVAALMALLNGLMRFGPPLVEARAILPGKGALVENTAGLLRLANLERLTGSRYAAVTRDIAAHALGLPAGMSAEAVDERLNRVSRTGPPFSALATAADDAHDTSALVAAAQDLYHWRRDKTGESG